MKKKLARLLRDLAHRLDPQGKPGRKRKIKKAETPLFQGLPENPGSFLGD
jgi:hypothetical protein